MYFFKYIYISISCIYVQNISHLFRLEINVLKLLRKHEYFRENIKLLFTGNAINTIIADKCYTYKSHL